MAVHLYIEDIEDMSERFWLSILDFDQCLQLNFIPKVEEMVIN